MDLLSFRYGPGVRGNMPWWSLFLSGELSANLGYQAPGDGFDNNLAMTC